MNKTLKYVIIYAGGAIVLLAAIKWIQAKKATQAVANLKAQNLTPVPASAPAPVTLANPDPNNQINITAPPLILNPGNLAGASV